MPNLTIYVPQDLADRLRAHDVPLSSTCQAALRRKVAARERLAAETQAKLEARDAWHLGAGSPGNASA